MNDSNPLMLPKARKDRLIIKELPDETLVYDLETDEAYCLNETASAVWKNCDGTNTVPEINSVLSKGSGVAVNEATVWLALDQLVKFKLLENTGSTPAILARQDRRQLMRNLGVAAFALPVVAAIVAPTAADAASPPCLAVGAPCSSTSGLPCCGTPCPNGANKVCPA